MIRSSKRLGNSSIKARSPTKNPLLMNRNILQLYTFEHYFELLSKSLFLHKQKRMASRTPAFKWLVILLFVTGLLSQDMLAFICVRTLVRNPTYVKLAEKNLLFYQHSTFIRISILERNLFHVLTVTNPLVDTRHWLFTQGRTLEKNLMFVRFAVKPSHHPVCYQGIWGLTLAWNLMDVMYVAKSRWLRKVIKIFKFRNIWLFRNEQRKIVYISFS